MLLHPTPPPHAHPTKPLRAFSENENLRGVQAKMLYVENFTGSPVNPPPENRPKCPKRKIHLPTINLHGAIWVFPTKMVPPNHAFYHFNRVFHYFHHPFWGVYHPYYFLGDPSICCERCQGMASQLGLYEPCINLPFGEGWPCTLTMGYMISKLLSKALRIFIRTPSCFKKSSVGVLGLGLRNAIK